MKTILALGLLISGSAASAQMLGTFPTSSPGTISGFSGIYIGASPESPLVWDSGDDTPTTVRQRNQQNAFVHAAFPGLEAEMAKATPYQARKLYERARRRALWPRTAMAADRD